MIESTQYAFLEDFIRCGAVKTFRTATEAADNAESHGLTRKDVVRVHRRFEIVWVIAEYKGVETVIGLDFDIYNVMATNDHGHRFLAEVKKYLKKP